MRRENLGVWIDNRQQSLRRRKIGAAAGAWEKGVQIAWINEVTCKQLMPTFVVQGHRCRRMSGCWQHPQAAPTQVDDRVGRPPLIDTERRDWEPIGKTEKLVSSECQSGVSGSCA